MTKKNRKKSEDEIYCHRLYHKKCGGYINVQGNVARTQIVFFCSNCKRSWEIEGMGYATDWEIKK